MVTDMQKTRWYEPFGPLILGFLRWRRIRQYERTLVREVEAFLR